MNRKHFVANAILWAAAILASAILRAPVYLSTCLLPLLAASAVLVTWPRSEPPNHTRSVGSNQDCYSKGRCKRSEA